MRESPWHLRLPTTHHYQWYRNLLDLHELTLTWLKETQSENPQDEFPKLLKSLHSELSREISDHLWMLDSILEKSLDSFLDDTAPEDLLGRLEHTIWAVQSWVLKSLMEESPAQERDTLESVLEQLSWKQGRSHGESRWRGFLNESSPDLRHIILSLYDSAFSGYPHGDGFLVRRAVETEVLIELRFCPHQSQYLETKKTSDLLCRMHAQWMRGYTYALHHRISLEHRIQTPRCIQRWFLV